MPSQKRERDDTDVEEGTRKKLKSTPGPGMSSPVNEIGMAAVIEATPVSEHQQTPHDPAVLQLLRGDFDDLRQLITCKICERLLYEPYVLSCGHTYCYSCLSTWFTTSKKKTCPMCRDNITQPPVPSHLIREMTTIFMRRHDLLPDGETVEQHNQWREEEAEIVKKDRDDGGLFKNIFNRPDRTVPIRDPVDGVDRCPRCNWEVEDGMCNNCGIHMDGASDDSSIASESDDEDLDADLDELDADLRHGLDPEFVHMSHFGYAPDDFESFDGSDDGFAAEIRRRYEILGPRFLDQRETGFAGFAESDEDEEDEDEGSLEDFIDDRDDIDITAQTISSQTDPGRPPQGRRRPTTIVSSPEDSEDDDEGDNTSPAPGVHQIDDDSEDDDDSDVPRVIGSRPRQLNIPQRGVRRPVVVVDSDEDSPSENDDETEGTAPDHVGAPNHTRRRRGFEGINNLISDESNSDESNSDESNSDSEVIEDRVDDVDSQSEDELDDSGEVGYGHHHDFDDDHDDDEDDMDSVTNNGFSPMQSTDGEPETSFHQFDVYGELDEDEDGDSE